MLLAFGASRWWRGKGVSKELLQLREVGAGVEEVACVAAAQIVRGEDFDARSQPTPAQDLAGQ